MYKAYEGRMEKVDYYNHYIVCIDYENLSHRRQRSIKKLKCDINMMIMNTRNLLDSSWKNSSVRISTCDKEVNIIILVDFLLCGSLTLS